MTEVRREWKSYLVLKQNKTNKNKTAKSPDNLRFLIIAQIFFKSECEIKTLFLYWNKKIVWVVWLAESTKTYTSKNSSGRRKLPKVVLPKKKKKA